MEILAVGPRFVCLVQKRADRLEETNIHCRCFLNSLDIAYDYVSISNIINSSIINNMNISNNLPPGVPIYKIFF